MLGICIEETVGLQNSEMAEVKVIMRNPIRRVSERCTTSTVVGACDASVLDHDDKAAVAAQTSGQKTTLEIVTVGGLKLL